MTYKELAQKIKKETGLKYRINGVNIYLTAENLAHRRAAKFYLEEWLLPEICASVGVKIHNPSPTVHYFARWYSTPFWMNVYLMK